MNTKQPYVVFLFVVAFVTLFFLPDETKYNLLTSPLELVYGRTLASFGKALLSGFLHIQTGHLIGNLTLFVLLGYVVEERLGHIKTLAVLLCSGVGALCLHVGYMPFSPVKFLGASGFVFGLLATYVKLIKKTS